MSEKLILSDGDREKIIAGFDTYQDLAHYTADYPEVGNFGEVYPVYGLCGEVGEFANGLKKVYRDDGGVLTVERLALLRKELGDIGWYFAETCRRFGFNGGEILAENIEKLFDRANRNAIKGDGDER